MKLLALTLWATIALTQVAAQEESAAAEYLKHLNNELAKRNKIYIEALWNYETNINEETKRKKNEISAELAKYMKEVAKDIQKFNWHSYQSHDLKRQFKMLSKLGYSALSESDYADYLNVVSNMESNYVNVKVCDFNKKEYCGLSENPHIQHLMAESRDPEELAHYWREFYDKAGTAVRSSFERYVELNTKAAKLNNFTSGAELWLDEYEDETMEQQVENIVKELSPLYLQLHGYVRYRLRLDYGDKVVSPTGPIPMHLLGNLWAEEWLAMADISPYSLKLMFIVNFEMMYEGYTPEIMSKIADDFFTSMNLTKLPQEFWNNSILEKPNNGRDLICDASAWDFLGMDDVRIKQCTRVTQDNLFTLYHELGHIQYFLQYQHLPFVYRNGANPGFHEAVGDVLSLSVSTQKHLERVGLLKKYRLDEELRINRLFTMALNKIVFLPFALSIVKYRWALFRGQVDKSNWNCAFWKLREEYSGIEPPVVRTENDFDATAKYHISADVEYLRYLVSTIIQFQLYKSACIKAGQYDASNPELPLDNCDIYGSIEAGKAFHDMLSLGASKPWPDALEAFTGERTMTGKAIAEYFEPLRVWLETQNKILDVPLGWTASDKCVAS